jgi:hypothetical protein
MAVNDLLQKNAMLQERNEAQASAIADLQSRVAALEAK